MIYLTVLMPCLDEEKTLKACILQAQEYLQKQEFSSEILIVDNGSKDNSINIAKSCNVRVVSETKKGYGNALRRGIVESSGKYIIMGDCDGSYDFSSLSVFIEGFKQGYDLVCGNRFIGGIEEGAMPFSHKIGVPILSKLASLRFNVDLGDFHCGLRGFRSDLIKSFNFESTGMEFATELIAKFKGYKIKEVPTKLYKDKRDRKPHLNTCKDGMRHLCFICKF